MKRRFHDLASEISGFRPQQLLGLPASSDFFVIFWLARRAAFCESLAGYEAVHCAPLQLKGSARALGAGERKKKKKKKAKDKAQILEQIVSSKKQQQKEEEERSSTGWTGGPLAQAAFEKMQEKQQMERILKKASKTHKQRVEEFNRHLDTLTEHHDIPKGSWTK
ncbi:protein FAM32A-like [Molothrus ater]|uniref:protein FAM32A-like n=1 Tax=Molothrus ater TaxID=84834 RepID=UPI00174D4B10|nr:protein FAM32A-like [Molothrus ater]